MEISVKVIKSLTAATSKFSVIHIHPNHLLSTFQQRELVETSLTPKPSRFCHYHNLLAKLPFLCCAARGHSLAVCPSSLCSSSKRLRPAQHYFSPNIFPKHPPLAFEIYKNLLRARVIATYNNLISSKSRLLCLASISATSCSFANLSLTADP